MLFGWISVTQVPSEVPQVSIYCVFAANPVPLTVKSFATVPCCGVTTRFVITSGILNTADLFAVNGSGATSGMPAGATKLIGTNGFVSAPLAADIIATGNIAAIATTKSFLFTLYPLSPL